jgi:hypothetical protein
MRGTHVRRGCGVAALPSTQKSGWRPLYSNVFLLSCSFQYWCARNPPTAASQKSASLLVCGVRGKFLSRQGLWLQLGRVWRVRRVRLGFELLLVVGRLLPLVLDRSTSRLTDAGQPCRKVRRVRV